jgi:hypothetical protein
MKPIFEGVARTLQSSLSGGALDEHMQQASKKVAATIVKSNDANLPDLQNTVTRTGPLSWLISFTASGLWPSVFGTSTNEEVPFETRFGGEK